jgi:hypothetical protein
MIHGLILTALQRDGPPEIWKDWPRHVRCAGLVVRTGDRKVMPMMLAIPLLRTIFCTLARQENSKLIRQGRRDFPGMV